MSVESYTLQTDLLECARRVSGAWNVWPIEIVLGLPKIHSALRLLLSRIWGFKALWGNLNFGVTGQVTIRGLSQFVGKLVFVLYK